MPVGAFLLSLVAGAQRPMDFSLPPIQDTNNQQDSQENYVAIALMIALLFGGLFALSKIK